MNAHILWLQWQALGSDVPIEVCALLAEVEKNSDSVDLRLDDSGWRSLHDASDAHRTVVLRGSQPLPLGEVGMARLALFCWRLHTVNHASSDRFLLCEAARPWWHPIVKQCHAEGMGL